MTTKLPHSRLWMQHDSQIDGQINCHIDSQIDDQIHRATVDARGNHVHAKGFLCIWCVWKKSPLGAEQDFLRLVLAPRLNIQI